MLKGIRRTPRTQRGLSLVELMVGITVGMFVVAAASMMVASQLGDNRKMLLEVQIQQDLRATADLVARDVRRAASWGTEANYAILGKAQSGISGEMQTTSQDVVLTGSDDVDRNIVYNAARVTSGGGPYGFRQNGHVIEARKLAFGGGADWQPVTDVNTLKVTGFSVTETAEPPVVASCPRKCADGTKNCWPTLQVRSYRIEIAGESTSDENVKRALSETIRVRNDRVAFRNGDPKQACP